MTKEEIKKKQNKIRFIYGIIGLVLFLIGISIIFITSIINSQKELPNDNTIIYESTSEIYELDNDENNIVDEDYIIINTMEEYQSFLSEIDNWSNELIANFETQINTNKYLDETSKIEKKDNYKTNNQERLESIKEILNNSNINEKNLREYSFIILEDVTTMSTLESSNLIDICKDENKININIKKEIVGVVGGSSVAIYVIKLDKDILKNTEIFVNISTNNNSIPNVAYKPIIYIYPEKEMNINVTLGYSNNITVSYPKYDTNWNVLAKPNGMLKDNKTKRELYALYYESINKVNFKVEEEGFVVKAEDTISFLEEKLEILGLNQKEQEEFIIYWLPILESNKYNYIRFASIEEINENMPLIVEPKPQTTIRILMIFKGLDKEIKVKEQQLNKIERNGYTVVEWGATILE